MPATARDLIFFGYSGASESTGAIERDGSFSWEGQTLKVHLQAARIPRRPPTWWRDEIPPSVATVSSAALACSAAPVGF
jgi:hypothetical protein